MQAAMALNAVSVEPMELGDESGDLAAREQQTSEDHLVYNPTLVSDWMLGWGKSLGVLGAGFWGMGSLLERWSLDVFLGSKMLL